MITISRLYDDYNIARPDLQRPGTRRESRTSDISIVANNAERLVRQRRPASQAGSTPTAMASTTGPRVRPPAPASAATVGGVAGLLAGLGLMAIPGLGPVVAAGWLVSTAALAVTGGAAGGLIGSLTQHGVDEDEANAYAEGVRRGGTLVTARVPEADAARVEAIMDRNAVNIRDRARDVGEERLEPVRPEGARPIPPTRSAASAKCIAPASDPHT